ncbi:MAG: NAD(P)-dependent oxidoreductase [Kofleriaceae bacterium]
MTATFKPVLLVGGSGVVGAHAVATLRRLQPGLPLTIGARNLQRASSVAEAHGNARAAKVDLDRADLGLGEGTAFSAVVTLLSDPTQNAMRYAQRHGLPYISFATWLFELAPEVALFIQKPASAPVLFLGHAYGGTTTLAALHFARELHSVDTVKMAAIAYDNDHGGPEANADLERGLRHKPLLRQNGRWEWDSADLERTIRTHDGLEITARAFPLLDVVSMFAATGATNVRFDFAMRSGAQRRSDAPATEMIIELEGTDTDGSRRRVRRTLLDDANLSSLSGRGLALAIERVLGLAGGPPVPPGLYHPEAIFDPALAVAKFGALGTRVLHEVP